MNLLLEYIVTVQKFTKNRTQQNSSAVRNNTINSPYLGFPERASVAKACPASRNVNMAVIMIDVLIIHPPKYIHRCLHIQVTSN